MSETNVLTGNVLLFILEIGLLDYGKLLVIGKSKFVIE